MARIPLRRRVLDARRPRTPWWAFAEDPENEERADRARREMTRFDELGAPVRDAIRGSKFDVSPTRMLLPPADPADDERIANIVKRASEDPRARAAYEPRRSLSLVPLVD